MDIVEKKILVFSQWHKQPCNITNKAAFTGFAGLFVNFSHLTILHIRKGKEILIKVKKYSTKFYLTIYFNVEMYTEKLLLLLLHEVKVISSKNYDAYTKSGTVFCNMYRSCEIFLFEVGMFDRYISSINFNMIVLIPAINSTIRPTFSWPTLRTIHPTAWTALY